MEENRMWYVWPKTALTIFFIGVKNKKEKQKEWLWKVLVSGTEPVLYKQNIIQISTF